MDRIHWPSFWRGFRDGLALPGAMVFAAAAVFRRAMIKCDRDVFVDARSLWWTREEGEARARKMLDEIYGEDVVGDEETLRAMIEQPLNRAGMH